VLLVKDYQSITEFSLEKEIGTIADVAWEIIRLQLSLVGMGFTLCSTYCRWLARVPEHRLFWAI